MWNTGPVDWPGPRPATQHTPPRLVAPRLPSHPPLHGPCLPAPGRRRVPWTTIPLLAQKRCPLPLGCMRASHTHRLPTFP